MKVGIIGLGDIAKKAYLPVVLSRGDIEPVLCTRNLDVLNNISNMYHIKNGVQTVDELIGQGIDAAFVHTVTEAHTPIVEKLLSNGIDVYVDKPAAYTYKDVEKLVALSQSKGRILMVGFNRRFAPMYKKLREAGSADIIIMQKNRTFNPDNIRRFIFDDFIHVVDTLRFLLPCDIEDISADSRINDGKLYNIILKLKGQSCTAIGIMNRDSGITEEVVEYMGSKKKRVVRDLNETTCFENGIESKEKFNDWDQVLYRRGFYQITDHFLSCVRDKNKPTPDAQDSLITHGICEKIVNMLERNM